MNQTLKKQIKQKIREFENIIPSQYFNELCFCILTANFQAQKSIDMQNTIKKGFSTLTLSKLKSKLKILGHRFPNRRAEFIVEARKHKNNLIKLKQMPDFQAREWLVKNIKGLGMKEASHFLRNIGKKNLAIIDRHILRDLNKEIKTPTKQQYLEIEQHLRKEAQKQNMSLAELDCYLWHSQTGKLLK